MAKKNHNSGRRIMSAVLAPILFGTVPGITQAIADDAVSNCCADLETRIAELEAAVAGKGNRRVSLEIAGQIDKVIMVWDDGVETNTYVVDNSFSSTRLWFRASAQITKDWKISSYLQVGPFGASSDKVDQSNADGSALDVRLRRAEWTIENATLGRVTLGRTSPATDNIYKFGNLSNSFSDAEAGYNANFVVRSISGSGTSSTLTWETLADDLDTSRGQFVRYDTPSLAGFVVSAAWGGDDIRDVSLRYSKETGRIRIASAIGYVEDADGTATTFGDEPRDVVASLGLQHLSSGLYVYTAAGRRQADVRPGFDDTAQYGYVQTGIEQKLNTLGVTTLYADFGYYSDWGLGMSFDRDVSVPGGTAINNSTVVDSQVQRWGFGATQKIDKAALDLYAVFNWYKADVVASTVANGLGPEFSIPTQNWFSAAFGSRIKF